MAVPDLGRQFVKLAADFPTIIAQGAGSGTVTGFSFTPGPDRRYRVEGVLLVRSDTATATGPRPGIEWPASGILGAGCVLSGLGTGNGSTIFHSEGELLTANRVLTLTGVDSLSFSYAAVLKAQFETGPVVVGDFQILMFTETGGNSVTMRAGSFLAVYSGFTDQ